MDNKKIKSILATLTMNLAIFIIFVLCLETGLRIIGYGHSLGRTIFTSREGGYNYTILCLGDSFTYGGNVEPNEIYPYYLWKILQKNKKNNVRVVNKGYCERNSSQLLKELKSNIYKFRPQIVIFLAGSSERTNLIGNHPNDEKFYHYPDMDEKRKSLPKEDIVFIGGRRNVIYLLRDIIFNTRVYKMSKAIIWHIRHEFICWNIKRNNSINLLLYSQFDSKESYTEITDRLAEYYHYSANYDKALELALKVVEQSPKDHHHYDDMGYYWLLSWAYEFQNKDAQYILERLNKIIYMRPEYKKHELFMRYYKMFTNKQEFDKYHDRKFVENLKEIIKICRDNDIQIIIQNYPRGFAVFNKYLEDAAKEYMVSFVDNYSIFSELIKKNGISKYLVGDGHCTPAGYKIIAQNVYAILEKEELLKK